jgi:hypothetical protein
VSIYLGQLLNALLLLLPESDRVGVKLGNLLLKGQATRLLLRKEAPRLAQGEHSRPGLLDVQLLLRQVGGPELPQHIGKEVLKFPVLQFAVAAGGQFCVDPDVLLHEPGPLSAEPVLEQRNLVHKPGLPLIQPADLVGQLSDLHLVGMSLEVEFVGLVEFIFQPLQLMAEPRDLDRLQHDQHLAVAGSVARLVEQDGVVLAAVVVHQVDVDRALAVHLNQ